MVPDAADAEPQRAHHVFARSIIRSLSSVTSDKYGILDDRQADAGSSHVGNPARRDSSRISLFVSPASSSGLRTAELARAWRPGR